MIAHHLMTLAAYRRSGRGSGMAFYYLFRLLYSLIGAWAWAVWTAFLGICLGLIAWGKR